MKIRLKEATMTSAGMREAGVISLPHKEALARIRKNKASAVEPIGRFTASGIGMADRMIKAFVAR